MPITTASTIFTVPEVVGSGGGGGGLGELVVEANTDGVGSPNIILAAESGTFFTNEGSVATNYHTLPTAAAGLNFTFAQQEAAQLIRVATAAGDTIRFGPTVSAVAGYAESTAKGDSLFLVAINDTEWLARSGIGTWNVV